MNSRSPLDSSPWSAAASELSRGVDPEILEEIGYPIEDLIGPQLVDKEWSDRREETGTCGGDYLERYPHKLTNEERAAGRIGVVMCRDILKRQGK